jgi:hypothetical protein
VVPVDFLGKQGAQPRDRRRARAAACQRVDCAVQPVEQHAQRRVRAAPSLSTTVFYLFSTRNASASDNLILIQNKSIKYAPSQSANPSWSPASGKKKKKKRGDRQRKKKKKKKKHTKKLESGKKTPGGA